MRSGGGGVTDKSPSHICHTIRHTSKHLFINKLKTTVTDVTDFYEKNFFYFDVILIGPIPPVKDIFLLPFPKVLLSVIFKLFIVISPIPFVNFIL